MHTAHARASLGSAVINSRVLDVKGWKGVGGPSLRHRAWSGPFVKLERAGAGTVPPIYRPAESAEGWLLGSSDEGGVASRVT